MQPFTIPEDETKMQTFSITVHSDTNGDCNSANKNDVSTTAAIFFFFFLFLKIYTLVNASKMHCNDSHVYTVNVKYSFAALISKNAIYIYS